MRKFYVVGWFLLALTMGVFSIAVQAVAQTFEFNVECKQTHMTPFEKMDQAAQAKFISLGRVYFQRCEGCHVLAPQDGPYSRNPMKGPSLFGILNKKAGSDTAYRYRKFAMVNIVWTPENIAAFLEDPVVFMRQNGGNDAAEGSAVGLHKTGCDEGRAAIARYLQENSGSADASLATAKTLIAERLAYLRTNRDYPGDNIAKSALLLSEAHREMRTGYPDNALVMAEEALRLEGGLSFDAQGQAHHLRGRIYVKKGNYMGAAEALTRALKFVVRPAVYDLRGDTKYCLVKSQSSSFVILDDELKRKFQSVVDDYQQASRIRANDEEKMISTLSGEKALLLGSLFSEDRLKDDAQTFEEKFGVTCPVF